MSAHGRPVALHAHTRVVPCEIYKRPELGRMGIRQHLCRPTGRKSAIEEPEQRLTCAEEGGDTRSQCTALDSDEFGDEVTVEAERGDGRGGGKQAFRGR